MDLVVGDAARVLGAGQDFAWNSNFYGGVGLGRSGFPEFSVDGGRTISRGD
jgi:hypothetical protein